MWWLTWWDASAVRLGTQDRSFLKSVKTDFPSLGGRKKFPLLHKGAFHPVKLYKGRTEEFLVASIEVVKPSSPKVLQDPNGQGSSYIHFLLYPLCTSQNSENHFDVLTVLLPLMWCGLERKRSNQTHKQKNLHLKHPIENDSKTKEIQHVYLLRVWNKNSNSMENCPKTH